MRTRIAVVLASLGRPLVLRELIIRLRAQTRHPDLICISITKLEDAPAPKDIHGAEVVIAPLGLCAQRNAGLAHVGDRADIITFFDDDFVPSSDYLQRLEAYFALNPQVAGITGHVLRDGITGPGLSLADADEALAAHNPPPLENASRVIHSSLYGCNMSYRRAAILNLRFDEALPLYGWLEDVDFSAQVRKGGLLVKTNAVAGVHLGAKAGRTSGVKFGYSQIANPLYLGRKGTMTVPHVITRMGRNLISNHLRALAPEPYVDRLGRIKGNWLAIGDVLRGQAHPARILSL